MKVAPVIVMALAGSALAAPYEWNFAGEAHNNVAGTITSAKMKFNSNTQVFSWDVTFGDGVAKGTDGYTLAVSTGPNPKGHAFELALIYFDATDMNSVAVSVYRYNGENNASSFSNPGDLLASNHLAIDDSVYAELHRHFDEGEIVEIGMYAAFCVGFGRWAATLHMVEELPKAYQDAPVGEGAIAPWGNDAVLVR